MTRFALLERLKAVQQMPKFERRDITTIAAILNTKALARHVEVCESDAGVARPPADAPSGPA